MHSVSTLVQNAFIKYSSMVKYVEKCVGNGQLYE